MIEYLENGHIIFFILTPDSEGRGAAHIRSVPKAHARLPNSHIMFWLAANVNKPVKFIKLAGVN